MAEASGPKISLRSVFVARHFLALSRSEARVERSTRAFRLRVALGPLGRPSCFQCVGWDRVGRHLARRDIARGFICEIFSAWREFFSRLMQINPSKAFCARA
ncbi:MAG: hypothetical protein ACK4NA_04060 [Alphaproteobacteria bacterium]